jgi:hypothetical protein
VEFTVALRPERPDAEAAAKLRVPGARQAGVSRFRREHGFAPKEATPGHAGMVHRGFFRCPHAGFS